jgi:hypothetical protein
MLVRHVGTAIACRLLVIRPSQRILELQLSVSVVSDMQDTHVHRDMFHPELS